MVKKKYKRIEDMPVLPEDAEVIRVSGRVRCEKCGETYYDHEQFAYPSLMNSVVKACFEDFGREIYLHL